jgi:hypothetical protein
VPRNDGWKSANGYAGKIGFSSSIVALGGNPEHRRPDLPGSRWSFHLDNEYGSWYKIG